MIQPLSQLHRRVSWLIQQVICTFAVQPESPAADGGEDAQFLAALEDVGQLGGPIVDEDDPGLLGRDPQPVQHLLDRLPRLDLDLGRRRAADVRSQRGVQVDLDAGHVCRHSAAVAR